ncbi:Cytochrome P450 [Moelleriella libera RCEF 2490]|uniref:Cytochrome P450 n=1 Tax=Moelleriella libera RCEF 2490 TaxID=1081109 RepID=A0A167Z3K7_9HYPO|nr:Cytochrome P450 [Moelleriella libera RCEF 2490]
MGSILVLTVGAAVAAYAFSRSLLRFSQDPREPPAAKTTIPFISPLLGFIQGMPNYLVTLRDEYHLPMYTLRMPGQRVYVVNSLPLISVLQRQNKTIAFAPIQAQAAAAVMGVGPADNAIIGSEQMLEHESYLSTFTSSIPPGLSPGPGLDELNGAAIRYISDSLAAMYGPKNPFRSAGLEQAWYDFEPCIVVHMLKAWPSVLARKSLKAREDGIIPAFGRYYAQHGHHQGSLLAQCQFQHNIDHGLRGRNVAATDVGHLVASLTNSVGSAFWLVYHVFSDPSRGKRIRNSCPLLLSTWQETLRYVHIGIAARVFIQDVMLDDQYLLKIGATDMTAAPVQHTDEAACDSTVGKLDHRRFLQAGDKKRRNPAAFRPFGGGTVLCPGRHFVSTEVMSFVALLLLRFDLRPVNKDGKWVAAPRKGYPMTSSMPTPKDKMNVEILPRDQRQWRVTFPATSNGVDVTAEDAANG